MTFAGAQGKSCFFIGHREAGEELHSMVREAIEKHITEYGVTQFIVGSYGGFDSVAASALLEAKADHPELTLLQLIPYHPAERTVPLRPGFDSTYYPFEGRTPPRRLAIVKANEEMIHTCDYLIAYVWHPASNAWKLIEKARKLEPHGGIRITNLKP